MTKRGFDLLACWLTVFVWLPLLAAGSLAILLTSGWPVFYVSRRRVYRDECIPLFKFRVMVRNAERIANRDTVPVDKARFLNIPKDSPLYTRVGRLIERWSLTEIPQVLHVLRGQMSVVGSRPLPENVVEALRAVFPNVEQRFATRAGVTGPVQLIGRDRIDDARRLELELAYCRICSERWSLRLDLAIALYTVLICLGLRRHFTPAEVDDLLQRHAVQAVGTPAVASTVAPRRRRRARRAAKRA